MLNVKQSSDQTRDAKVVTPPVRMHRRGCHQNEKTCPIVKVVLDLDVPDAVENTPVFALS